jgi:hypothetical protein
MISRVDGGLALAEILPRLVWSNPILGNDRNGGNRGHFVIREISAGADPRTNPLSREGARITVRAFWAG